MEQPKEYYAFISYKREDEKWAKWLQDKLEHYKFPTNLNGRTDLPKHIRPTFRDVTDLKPGLLAEEINNALRNSEWLIVVCSPRSAKSPWVCKEAQTFIDLGRADHIVPFVIEGNPFSTDPNTECYPEALLNLTGGQELLAANINEMGRDAAAIKVVARMFALRFDALWQRFEREQKLKRGIKLGVAVTVLLISIVIAGWMYHINWELKRSQSRFIADKAEELLKDGDSYSARILLLEALPRDLRHPFRPFVPEAERALRKAFLSEDAILRGHIGAVTSAGFRQNGRQLWSQSWDGTNRLWDLKTGLLLRTDVMKSISTKTELGTRRALWGSPNNHIYIVDTLTCDTLQILIGHTNYVSDVTFSPDSLLIASASGDNTLCLWDVHTGQMLHRISRHTNIVNSVEFSPDGKYVVSASNDSLACIWDVESGKLCQVLKGHSGAVKYSVFSPDGNTVISTSDDGTVRIWDINRDNKAHLLSKSKSYNGSTLFSPNGKFIFSHYGQVWNAETGEFIKRHEHIPPFKSFDISPNSKYVASTSGDANIQIRDLISGSLTQTLKSPYPVEMIAYSPDECHLAFSSYNHLYVWNFQTQYLDSITQNHFIHHFAFSPDGIRIALASNAIYVWNLEKKKAENVFKENYPVISQDVRYVSFSPDGKRIIAISKDISVWDIKSHKKLFVLDGTKQGSVNRVSHHASYSRDCKYILADIDGDIGVWSAENGVLIQTMEEYSNVYFTAFSPNGKRILSTSFDGVRIWDFPSLQELIDQTRERFKNRPLTPEERRKYYLE